MVVKVAEQSGWRIAQNGDKAEEIVIPVTVLICTISLPDEGVNIQPVNTFQCSLRLRCWRMSLSDNQFPDLPPD